jgi:hypothetical protein
VALADQALVSTEEVRTYLAVGKTDLPGDALLEQIIEGLSARIVERTGHCYISDDSKDKASSREFTFDPGAKHAEITDCRSVEKVEVSGTPGDEATWRLLGVEEYALEPLSGSAATFTRVRFLLPQELPAQGVGWGVLSAHVPSNERGGTPWPNEVRAELNSYAVVRVTAKWGFGPDRTTVPPNVKLALLMWLQNIHKRDQAFFSEDFGKAMAGLKMPADVEELLEGQESYTTSAVAV